MADQIDSDTCIGSKRRISVIEEALLLQQSSTSPAFLPHEDSLDSHIFLPSSPEKEQDIIQDIPSPSSFKKVRCSFDFADNQVPDFDPSEENSGSWNEERSRLADSVAGSFENERTCDDFWGKNETLGEKVEETESLGMGFGHNQRNADDVSGKDVKAEIKKESPSGACKEFDDYRKKAEMDSVIIENNEVSMVKESLLEARKKQLLQEVEAGSIFKDKAHVENVDSCDASSGILRSLKGINDSVRSSLKIEVIDDTALIEPVPFAETGNGGVKGGRNNGKKSVKQETEGKKVKRPRRKGKGVTKVLEMSEMQNKGTEADDTQNSVGERRDGMKRRYSRKEMETLRFINIVEQRQLWSVIYTGLGDSVIGQYDDLESSKHTKNVRLNFDPRQHFRRSYNVPGILGVAATRGRWDRLNIIAH